MVKFNERLHANIVNAWADFYMDYGQLKGLISGKSKAIGGFGTSSGLREKLIPAHAAEGAQRSRSFIAALIEQADKVEAFFNGRMRHALEDWSIAKGRLAAFPPIEDSNALHADHDVLDALESSVRELYRMLTRLRNYCAVNYTGFIKITKKYLKKVGSPGAEDVDAAMDHVDRCRFSGDHGNAFPALDVLIDEVEETYARMFCGERVHEARYRLLSRQWRPTDWRTFKRGLNIGILLQLLLWVTWAVFMESKILSSPTWDQTLSASSAWMVSQLPVYRGIGCLTLAAWCWGACLYCWELGRVHYLYIFEFDDREARSFSQVFDWATAWTQWFLLNFLFFFKSLHGASPIDVPPGVYPALLYASGLAVLLPSSKRQLDFWGVTAWRIVSSPFAPVSFWDAFAADALTSLVQPVSDIVYATCFVVSLDFLDAPHAGGFCERSTWAREVVRPLVAALPLWFRLCQNFHQYFATHSRFPWLANAFKYAVSLTVVVFGLFHPQVQRRGALTAFRAAYLCAFCGATLYSFAWDVLMDWKLVEVSWTAARTGKASAGAEGSWPAVGVRMRGQRMYGGAALPYVLAIVLDFFLRFMWTTTLIPSEHMLHQMPTFYSVITPFTFAAEVCRRAMWSVLRLESEHLHTEGFRRVQVVPLHFDDDDMNSRETPEAYDEQQKRSKALVITEIVAFSVVVALLATTAVLTRSTGGTSDGGNG